MNHEPRKGALMDQTVEVPFSDLPWPGRSGSVGQKRRADSKMPGRPNDGAPLLMCHCCGCCCYSLPPTRPPTRGGSSPVGGFFTGWAPCNPCWATADRLPSARCTSTKPQLVPPDLAAGCGGPAA